ncbi:MAG: MerR family transcriptional regulator [Labilithrix sp.]
MKHDLPPKLFFRIGEVAGLVGVEPHVLRYWEREFRTIRPTKSAKGQRVYSRKDVENLLRVRDLLYRDGFTIAGAKKKLTTGAAPAAAAESERDVEVETESAPQIATQIEVAAAPVSSAPVSDTRSTRDKLVALRDEVEGFLAELSRR